MTSGFETRPPQSFEEQLVAVTNGLMDQALAGLPPDVARLIPPGEVFIPFRRDLGQLPAAIQGSDAVALKHASVQQLPLAVRSRGQTERDYPDRQLGLWLFNDGSPWVLESDLRVDENCGHLYVILSAPDFQPCMINQSLIERVSARHPELNVGTAEEIRREFGDEAVHLLTEEDQSSLLRLLAEAGPHIHFTDLEYLARTGHALEHKQE